MKRVAKLLSLPLAAGLSVLMPVPAAAQVVPQATPLATEGCAEYQVVRPPGAQITLDLTRLRNCIDALRNAVTAPAADTVVRAIGVTAGRTLLPEEERLVARAAAVAAEEADPGAEEERRHLRLRKIYLSYARLRLWVDCALRPSTTTSGCRLSQPLSADQRAVLADTFGQFAEALHLSLKGHGLTQPFAASLVTAFSFQNAASASKTGSAAAAPAGPGETDDSSSTSAAAGFVVFESVHFFARPERTFDVDVAGTIGFRPALTLLTPKDAAATSLIAQYQQAFAWSVAFEPNWRVADLAEVSGFVGVGEAILSSKTALVENGSNSQLAIATGADAGARFIEFGAKVGIFGETLDLLHLSKGLLSPMLGFTLGYRRDQRFESIVLPDGLGNPQDRLFLRLSTSAIPLTDSARPDQLFTLTFALEHEWARTRGTGAVPHGTRVLIRGDLNLFKATNDK
jgi:hypothetical protein